MCNYSIVTIDDMEARWHASGWAPVYRTNGRRPVAADLVGFTTFTLPNGVRIFRFSERVLPQWGARDLPTINLEGAAVLKGEARVIDGGGYLAWLVIDADPAELPEFWAL